MDPSLPHPTRLLEVHEVAYQLKTSHETVLRFIRTRKLAAIKLGTRSWRVDPMDLQAFIDAQRVQIAAAERALDQELGAATRRVEAMRAAVTKTKVPA